MSDFRLALFTFMETFCAASRLADGFMFKVHDAWRLALVLSVSKLPPGYNAADIAGRSAGATRQIISVHTVLKLLRPVTERVYECSLACALAVV